MNANMQKYAVVFTTDIVTIGLQFEGSKLSRIEYLNKSPVKEPDSKLVLNVKNKIEKFVGADKKTKNIKVDFLLRVTTFQEKVLNQLQKIPYGETRTYGEIAKILHTSPRAVGNACRNNPLPIIIPCHRVIAVNGLGGYSGARSGRLLNIKRKLLANEGVYF